MISDSEDTKKGMLRRVGVLGDIHCEDGRLKTALKYFETARLDLICSVGDIVDGSGDPDQTIDLLIEHSVTCVRGNHERWLINNQMRDLPESHRDFDLNTRSLEFIKKLPLWRKLETVAGQALLCHGLGEDDMGGVWPGDGELNLHSNIALWKLVNSHECDFILNGHTHRRLVKKIDALTLINAGTLFHKHDPCCLIVDFEKLLAEYFNLPDAYNIVEAEKVAL